jgi:membrane-associated phospholipid phosphatase
MDISRRMTLAGGLAWASGAWANAPASDVRAGQILSNWYRLILELVRHTPTYSPPVASRSFAYLGIGAWMALSPDRGAGLQGQLTGFGIATRGAQDSDPACRLHATLSTLVAVLFANTGPTGQRALSRMTSRLAEVAGQGLTLAASTAAANDGQMLADDLLAWAAQDGGAQIDNLGFPEQWTVGTQPQDWVPTSAIRLQQSPLLPGWGRNRTFAMPVPCDAPDPTAFDETPGSAFDIQALEVLEISRNLTDDQRRIAQFWSDDPMLSPTPPGHWMSIGLQVAAQNGLTPLRTADLVMRLGVAVADAFIACWRTKYLVNLLRPVTYLRRHHDPAWSPLLITPPFPEYTSGHSVQSAAAAAVLTAVFGPDYAFTDETHADDGLPARSFPTFAAAASEAAISRLYGGIHFRAGVENGLTQGAGVGAFAVALRTEV